MSTPICRTAIPNFAIIAAGAMAAKSEFARMLRNPAGVTFNHYGARLSKQNIERMKYAKPGGSWRDIPDRLLPKGLVGLREKLG